MKVESLSDESASPSRTLLALATLVTFAVSQSVYEVLAANEAFLHVRRVNSIQLLAIVCVFNILPALGVFALWMLAQRVNTRLGRYLLGVCYVALTMLFFLQIQNHYLPGWQSFRWSYPAWVLIATVLVALGARFERVFRTFVLALSPGMLLFPGVFLYRTWPEPPRRAPVRDLARSSVVSLKQMPPIFFLVFDELTLYALLDERGQIDAARFPNFKRLAGGSYWFRNTTANADETVRAVPVIVTGNFPNGFEASRQAYPNNLFTLLQPYYGVYIHENWFTRFCDPESFRCLGPKTGGTTRALLLDVCFLLTARLLPPPIHQALPDPTRTWGYFRPSERHIRDVVRHSREVLDSLLKIPRQDVLFFSHIVLPHSPYLLTAEGQIYSSQLDYFSESIDAFTLKLMHERYLMQVAYVDGWLGQFLNRLETEGFYDRSLLVVTADHGVSWKPESPGPWLAKDRAEMILAVPLLIKLPFQKQGVVSTRDVQHVDLVPTIAAYLGLEVPWPVAGRSAFDDRAPSRAKVAYDGKNNRYEFSETLGLTPLHVRLDSPLVGRRIRSFQVVPQAGVTGHVDRIERTPDQQPADLEPVVYVSGWAAPIKEPPPSVAVSETLKRTGRYAFAKVGGDGGIFQDIAGLVPGGQYRITAWARGSGAQGLAMLWVHDTREANRASDGPRKVSATGFERFQLTFLATESEKVRIHLHSTRSSEPVFWDDVTIEPGGVTNGGFESGALGPWTVYGRLPTVPVSEPLKVVLAVNGEIVTVGQPSLSRPDVARHLGSQERESLYSGWMVSFGAGRLKDGDNDVSAYVLVNSPEDKLAFIGSRVHTHVAASTNRRK